VGAGVSYRCGVDCLDGNDAVLLGRRVGLITNPSAVTADFTPTVEVLASNYKLAALFGPEHGVRGDAQAGVAVGDNVSCAYGVPEYSLYGATRRLQREWLDQVEVVVFDIQDIGSRYYTYIYTMGLALADCAAAGIPFVVLDRPNPLGGLKAEGVLIRPEFHSFVGNYGLSVRHPLTVGEMAQRINRIEAHNCDLTVVQCSGWQRQPLGDETSWINPSPNMPSLTTALVYNGTCLFEATNISEGRGTTRPYELIGAPFIEHEHLATTMNSQGLAGVHFRPCCFTPTFDKHMGQLCRGVQLHVTDREAFNGFAAGVSLFQAIREQTPQMEITSAGHLNNLFGSDSLLKGRESLQMLLARAERESAEFVVEAEQDHLYVRSNR